MDSKPESCLVHPDFLGEPQLQGEPCLSQVRRNIETGEMAEGFAAQTAQALRTSQRFSQVVALSRSISRT